MNKIEHLHFSGWEDMSELVKKMQPLANFGAWEFNLLNGNIRLTPQLYGMFNIDTGSDTVSVDDLLKKIYPDDVIYIQNNLSKLLSNPLTENIDVRILKADGTYSFISTGFLVDHDAEGNPTHITGFSQDLTRQKEESKKIDDINREISNFFNTIDEVFYSIDVVNNVVLNITAACKELYGYDVAECINGYPAIWEKIIYSEDQYIIDEGNKQLLSGSQINTTYRIIRKDGAVRWLESKVIPYIDADGKLLRIDGVSRDITDRKAAQERIFYSEERYRRIVETAQEGIWTIDENNLTNFVNKKIGEILEYPPEEMIGKGLFDFMDEEDKLYAIECMERRRKGAKENLDIRYVTKTGKYVWAHISANPIFDEKGNYNGALAMVVDITQRKRDEEALRNSEANLRTVFENTDLGFILYDKNLKIASFNTLANDFSVEYFHKKLKVGFHASDYFPKDKKALVDKLIKNNTDLVTYESCYTDKNGTAQWFDVKWVGVNNEKHEHIGLIMRFKNITDKKMSELERERITTELIRRNSELEQFTFIVSHNLRAPVANIMGLSAMLEEDLSSPDIHQIIQGISVSVKNMDMVIKDLNHIIQVKDTVHLDKGKVYFNQLVNDITISIQDMMIREKVELHCDFNQAAYIDIAAGYLHSVFYNLILNSIKYKIPGTRPCISISSSVADNKIKLVFKDNGRGIDLEKYGSDMFGLYKRFDTTVEGRGMGLFMVKAQVEAMGGTISVQSELNNGTDFTILLSQ